MATMEAVGPDTIVVTTVHDDQVVDIPEELVEDHDLTVDYIVTPTQVEHNSITHANTHTFLPILQQVPWDNRSHKLEPDHKRMKTSHTKAVLQDSIRYEYLIIVA